MAECSSLNTIVSRICSELRTHDAVKGLVLAGSLATSPNKVDAWSDADLILIVADSDVVRYFPDVHWLSSVGEIYASARSSVGPCDSTRVYFSDGLRIDFTVIAESALADIGHWPSNPFYDGSLCLFSRSELLDRALRLPYNPNELVPDHAAAFAQICDDFWFKGMLAVSKVARDDLLVALHLCLDLIRDCCVLAMMIRDYKLGTTHHRKGAEDGQYTAGLQAAQHPYTASGILDGIEQSAILFEALSHQLDPDYQDRRQPLLKFVAKARAAIK